MLLDNLVNIIFVYIGVPDTIGIDHCYRPFFAAIHATGRINPYTAFLAGDTQLLGTLLGVIPHGLRIMIHTAGLAVIAVIDTKEQVVAIVGHDSRVKGKNKRGKSFRKK
jgi:hypothetical protein